MYNRIFLSSYFLDLSVAKYWVLHTRNSVISTYSLKNVHKQKLMQFGDCKKKAHPKIMLHTKYVSRVADCIRINAQRNVGGSVSAAATVVRPLLRLSAIFLCVIQS